MSVTILRFILLIKENKDCVFGKENIHEIQFSIYQYVINLFLNLQFCINNLSFYILNALFINY